MFNNKIEATPVQCKHKTNKHIYTVIRIVEKIYSEKRKEKSVKCVV